MRIAYLECFSGMSGDMFLGALVDAGVPPQILEDTVSALKIGGRLEFSRVVRSGISATKVDVWVDGKKDSPREEIGKLQTEAGPSRRKTVHSYSNPCWRSAAMRPEQRRPGKRGGAVAACWQFSIIREICG